MIAAAMLCFFPEGTVIEREDGPDYVARKGDGTHRRWEVLSADVLQSGYVPKLLRDAEMAALLVKDCWKDSLAGVTVIFPAKC